MTRPGHTLPLLLLAASAAPAQYTFTDAQHLITTYCTRCHQSKSPAAGLNLTAFNTPESIAQGADKWTRILSRVHNSEMPPQGSPASLPEQREAFTTWLHDAL